MKHAKLIRKLEEATAWRDVVPGLLLTVKERNALLKLLRGDLTDQSQSSSSQ